MNIKNISKMRKIIVKDEEYLHGIDFQDMQFGLRTDFLVIMALCLNYLGNFASFFQYIWLYTHRGFEYVLLIQECPGGKKSQRKNERKTDLTNLNH